MGNSMNATTDCKCCVMVEPKILIESWFNSDSPRLQSNCWSACPAKTCPMVKMRNKTLHSDSHTYPININTLAAILVRCTVVHNKALLSSIQICFMTVTMFKCQYVLTHNFMTSDRTAVQARAYHWLVTELRCIPHCQVLHSRSALRMVSTALDQIWHALACPLAPWAGWKHSTVADLPSYHNASQSSPSSYPLLSLYPFHLSFQHIRAHNKISPRDPVSIIAKGLPCMLSANCNKNYKYAQM